MYVLEPFYLKHIHTYTYIHIHTHTYTYIHIHTHSYTFTHIHTHTYNCNHTYTYVIHIHHSFFSFFVFVFFVHIFELILFFIRFRSFSESPTDWGMLISLLFITNVQMCTHLHLHHECYIYLYIHYLPCLFACVCALLRTHSITIYNVTHTPINVCK